MTSLADTSSKACSTVAETNSTIDDEATFHADSASLPVRAGQWNRQFNTFRQTNAPSSAANPQSALSTLTPRPRVRNDLSTLTIGKLNISKLGIYGRDKEIAILNKAFENVVRGTTQIHVIVISGPSGTGKSKLAASLDSQTKKHKGLLVNGKFDIGMRNKPYSAIANACAQICAEILQLERDNLERSLLIRKDIAHALRDELALITQKIPALDEIFDLDQGLDRSNETKYGSQLPTAPAEQANLRFQYAFLRFMRILAKHFFPLVLVLDDLQWADGSSLDLLSALVTDREDTTTMLVMGTYRSNEVGATHILSKMLNEFELKQNDGNFKLVRTEIGNLDIDATCSIMQDLLACDQKRIVPLARICHKKTDGNVFYLLTLLSSLIERNLLQFSLGTLSWNWDEDTINASTSAAANVVDLLTRRMMMLSSESLNTLRLAACLGSKFERRMLEVIWLSSDKTLSQKRREKGYLVESLESLVTEGFLEACTEVSSTFMWAHDKVQEAALSLIPISERASFARRMGEILASKLQDDELESSIFTVVNLLNQPDQERSVDDLRRCAILNLSASRQAMTLCAFESAAKYARYGIWSLSRNCWKEQYPLALELYSIGAKAEGFLGNVDQMKAYCDAVLQQKDKPLSDKFEVYHAWVDSILNRGEFSEASNILFNILGKFNCCFPKRKIAIVLALIQNVVTLKGRNKSFDFSALPEMTDTTRLHLMKFLDTLSICLHLNADIRMPLVHFRRFDWTIKYGFCDYSPNILATLGVVWTGVLHDLQGGSKFGEQALKLAEKTKTNTSEAARVMFTVYSFLFPWTKPATTVIKPLLEAYHLALQRGDTEIAAWAACTWMITRYFAGSPLELLEADMFLYSKQMKDLKRDQQFYCSKCTRQVILNLMGRDNIDDPIQITGQFFTESDRQHFVQNKNLKVMLWTVQSILLTYFGDHAKHAERFSELGPDYVTKAIPGASQIMWHSFLAGVSCFETARRTGKRKYAKLAEKMRSTIKRWIAKGNPNVVHFDAFLDAEAMVLKGNKAEVIKHYVFAIQLAARGGFQQDAAFASERLGEYYLRVENNREEAAYRFQEAIKYWKSWGALAKVRWIEDNYDGVLMRTPCEIFVGGAISSLDLGH